MAETVKHVQVYAETLLWELSRKVQELEAEGAGLVEELNCRQGRCREMLQRYAELREEKERRETEGRQAAEDLEKLGNWVEKTRKATLHTFRQCHSKALSILATHTHQVADTTRQSHNPTISNFLEQATALTEQLHALEREEAVLSEQVKREAEELDQLQRAKEELRKELESAVEGLRQGTGLAP